MKAMRFLRYGSPDDLRLEEVPMPDPAANEVRVQVRAASVNSWDWELLRGVPFVNRLSFGVSRPKILALGADVAGEVEAVGSSVTRFQPGDAVYGDLAEGRWGAFAEFVCAREDALAPKPPALSFAQAAAVPQAAVMALQALREPTPVRAGQQVLINGAGGGVGTFAVQLARSFGAEVTGVDRPAKLDAVRDLGAAHVIDCTREDFTRGGRRYDRIADVVATRPVSAYRRALAPGGVGNIIGGHTGRLLQAALLGPLLSLAGGGKVRLLMARANKDLSDLSALLEAGTVVPIIDRTFPLAEVPEAIRYFSIGGAIGKVVITI